ncbi:hypothetical protein [Streptomyces sp. NPDC001194]|uniref:hypothetical protein n=1 Tax=Streptomyces sp. NPDC001194 TaxID=3364547 RepID=UPI00368CBF59
MMAQVLMKGGQTGVTVVAGKVVGKSGGKVAAKLAKPFLQDRFADSAETYYRAKLAHGNGPTGSRVPA